MLKLEDSDIHLWYADQAEFNVSELEENCITSLTDQEAERYQRYTSERRRKQFLLGRMLIRRTLSQYAELPPAAWKFVENDYGKPTIEIAGKGHALFFNLSHSGDRLVLAIANNESIGVDIESRNKPRRLLKVADRYFSPTEVADLFALSEAEQLSRFYDLWTLKEAYIKACGLGLAISLQHFSYSFPSDRRILVDFSAERNDDAAQWQFWLIDPGGPFKMGLAIKSGLNKITKIQSRKYLALEEIITVDTDIVRD